MEEIRILKELAAELLSEEINYALLQGKLEDFKSMLLRVSGLNVESLSSKEDLQFENGIAIGPAWAALCTDDFMRTRQFVRGIYKAIEHLRHKKQNPINILYAGTGPFATLILPLLTKFDADEIQLTLLEINPETIAYLEQTFKQLDLLTYVEHIICADASNYYIEAHQKVDLLISETMQNGLQKEQQVPIMLNLVRQLRSDTIIIPNKIQLDLALIDSRINQEQGLIEPPQFKPIKTLLEFDKVFIKHFLAEAEKRKRHDVIDLCDQVCFRQEKLEDYTHLAILTAIRVYEDEWIENNASGLTVPKVLLDLNNLDKAIDKISIRYVMDKNPYFDYELKGR